MVGRMGQGDLLLEQRNALRLFMDLLLQALIIS